MNRGGERGGKKRKGTGPGRRQTTGEDYIQKRRIGRKRCLKRDTTAVQRDEKEAQVEWRKEPKRKNIRGGRLSRHTIKICKKQILGRKIQNPARENSE